MRVVHAVAPLLALLAAPAVHAEKQFQLVGFTSQSFNGNSGIVRFTQACQSQFAASRMCSSEEVMNTVALPSSGSDEGWVRPSYKPAAAGSLGLVVLDASGQSTDVSNGKLSCDGWTRNGSTADGLTVNSNGQFQSRACDSNRQVACCALVPVPEPPVSLLEGGTAATLAATCLLGRSSQPGG